MAHLPEPNLDTDEEARTLYEQLAEKEQKHRQMPKMLEQLIQKIQARELDVDALEARMRQIERLNTKDDKNIDH